MVSRITAGVTAFASSMSVAVPAQIPPPPLSVTIPHIPSGVSVANDRSNAAPLLVKSLDPSVALLGLNPCRYSRSYANGEPSGAVTMVGNPEIDCATWKVSKAPDVTVFSGSVTIAGSRLPIVAFYDGRNLAPSTPRRIVIDVIGGPGSDISPGLNDDLPLFLVERGVFVVRLGYTGTRHGSSFPRPDLDNASFQVGSYATRLRQLHPRGKIVLLGESVGGLISAKAAGDLPAAPVIDGLAMVMPLVFSANEAVGNFNHLFSARHEQVPASPRIRLLESPHDLWSDGRLATVPGLDLLRGFFPETARRRNLESYLARTRGLKKMLAFGENDDRTGNAGIASIARDIPDLDVVKLERSGHFFDRRTAQQLVDRMWDLFLK
jgi:pimeloyl-ACP methyl ester carboxylesterase